MSKPIKLITKIASSVLIQCQSFYKDFSSRYKGKQTIAIIMNVDLMRFNKSAIKNRLGNSLD